LFFPFSAGIIGGIAISEFKPGKCPVQKGIDGHGKHQGTKQGIRFEQINHIGGLAIVKGMQVQVFKVDQGSHIVSLRG
jgi:hypothetical protein